MNAAADWVQGTWTSPPLPAGASALSLGLNLISNGTLTTDDYEMTDAGLVPSFTDVPASNQFYNEISWLALNNITTGYPDNTFRPLASVNRDAMAAFIYRLNGKPVVTGTSSFTDVAANNQFYPEITWLSKPGSRRASRTTLSTLWNQFKGMRLRPSSTGTTPHSDARPSSPQSAGSAPCPHLHAGPPCSQQLPVPAHLDAALGPPHLDHAPVEFSG